MLFKQLQVFQITNSKKYTAALLNEKLAELNFSPCLPSMPDSAGWIPPLEENQDALTRAVQNSIVFCMQVEEKILPATVIRQELSEAVKQLETSQSRKLRAKEKFSLKDEITMTMLPRAFSKFTKVYAYLDTNNHWLILGTTNAKLTEKFLSLFKKTVTEEISSLELKKVSTILTHWLKTQHYPTEFAIEKACVLQDPNNEGRVVRCQQQDLFAQSIQALIKDGCEASQLALTWQDRVTFNLSEDFSLRSIQFQDELLEQLSELEPETAQQQFDADCLIMSTTISDVIRDLLSVFSITAKSTETKMALVGT